jgi:hypothetical protein
MKLKINLTTFSKKSHDSSVSIVLGYRLDGQGSGVDSW